MDLEKHSAAPAPAPAPAAAPVPAPAPVPVAAPAPAPAITPAGLRASDADRDRVASVLADAVAEGRIDAEEHSERLDTLYSVKTVGELEALVRDLPAPGGGARTDAMPQAVLENRFGAPGATPSETVLSVCSSSVRKGHWRPGAHTRAISLMGDISIDLTEAVFEQQVTEIDVTCILGNVEIKVPENVTLRGYGSGVLGNFEVHGNGRAGTDPHAPVVIVRGFSLLGNIEARPKTGSRLVDLALKLRKRLEG